MFLNISWTLLKKLHLLQGTPYQLIFFIFIIKHNSHETKSEQLSNQIDRFLHWKNHFSIISHFFRSPVEKYSLPLKGIFSITYLCYVVYIGEEVAQLKILYPNTNVVENWFPDIFRSYRKSAKYWSTTYLRQYILSIQLFVLLYSDKLRSRNSKTLSNSVVLRMSPPIIKKKQS